MNIKPGNIVYSYAIDEYACVISNRFNKDIDIYKIVTDDYSFEVINVKLITDIFSVDFN